jgi:hypothetical protein
MGWAFLLGSFAMFLAIAVSVPLGIGAFIRNSKQPLPVSVQANQGTVRIDDRNGQTRTTLVGEPAETVEAGSEILTDATATALLSVFPPDDDQILARMQLYGNTNVRLDNVDAPRYTISDSEQRLELSLQSGRLRLTIPELSGRPTAIRIAMPRGNISIVQAGQYAFEVTNVRSQVAVLAGQAMVTVEGESLTLSSDQRAVIPTEGVLVGPVSTERNLITNGNFADFFDNWTLFSWKFELASQPEGEVIVSNIGGEPTLHLIRSGQGHADVKLRQAINQDVTDYQSLQLFLTFRIMGQTLSVCGIRGSECPLFLRVNYLDDAGISHTWQHGFYGAGQVDATLAPDACVPCDVVQTSHQFVQLGLVHFYEADFRADLARQGFLPPRIIENVELVASGHSFELDVLEVAFMAKE